MPSVVLESCDQTRHSVDLDLMSRQSLVIRQLFAQRVVTDGIDGVVVPIHEVSGAMLSLIVEFVLNHSPQKPDIPELPPHPWNDPAADYDLFSWSSTTYVKGFDFDIDERDCSPEMTANIEYLDGWQLQFLEMNRQKLHELMKAADYLGMSNLMRACAWKMADMLKGKSALELKEFFNLNDDDIDIEMMVKMKAPDADSNSRFSHLGLVRLFAEAPRHAGSSEMPTSSRSRSNAQPTTTTATRRSPTQSATAVVDDIIHRYIA